MEKTAKASNATFTFSVLSSMFTPFNNFLQVKYKYCVSYFGNSNEYIELLRLLRPFIENQFRGIQVHLACKDEAYYLLEDEPRVCSKKTFNKTDYCYVRDLIFDNATHPVQIIMEESKIRIPVLCGSASKPTNNVFVYTFGNAPTRTLNAEETCSLIKNIQSSGRNCRLNEPWDGVSSVVSVEGEQLIKAAMAGIDCTLLDSGVGTGFYKKIFLHMRVLSP